MLNDSRTSDEKRIADFLGAHLNTFSFHSAHVAFSFISTYGSGIQRNMMDLVMAFLNGYASKYINGEVLPGDNMFQQCSMAYHMLSSVSMAPAAPLPVGEEPEFGVDKTRGIDLD